MHSKSIPLTLACSAGLAALILVAGGCADGELDAAPERPTASATQAYSDPCQDPEYREGGNNCDLPTDDGCYGIPNCVTITPDPEPDPEPPFHDPPPDDDPPPSEPPGGGGGEEPPPDDPGICENWPASNISGNGQASAWWSEYEDREATARNEAISDADDDARANCRKAGVSSVLSCDGVPRDIGTRTIDCHEEWQGINYKIICKATSVVSCSWATRY